MKLLQDLAESSRRLEIRRLDDIRRLNTEMKQYFETLENTIKQFQRDTNSSSWWRWGVGLPARSTVESSRPCADPLILALSTKAREAQEYGVEREIIDALTFKGMLNRQLEIKTPHTATFE